VVAGNAQGEGGVSLNRFAVRRDAAEPHIVLALEKVGALVYRLDTPADLLVFFRNRWSVIEVKARKRTDQPAQELFRRLTGTRIVSDADQALRLIGATW
jgi:hypothetical protein